MHAGPVQVTCETSDHQAAEHDLSKDCLRPVMKDFALPDDSAFDGEAPEPVALQLPKGMRVTLHGPDGSAHMYSVEELAEGVMLPTNPPKRPKHVTSEEATEEGHFPVPDATISDQVVCIGPLPAHRGVHTLTVGCQSPKFVSLSDIAEHAEEFPEEVNHPNHYGGNTTYETIKVIRAWGFMDNALRFNSIKYLSRAGKKGDGTAATVRDLRKAIWYIEAEIEELISEESK